MISGTTRLYPIVGHPVSQVKSPDLFNPQFAAQDIDAVMIALDVVPEQFPAFVEVMRHAENMKSAVITVPHKQQAAQLAQQKTPIVQALGAANLLRVNEDGEIEGDMVDGEGFVAALRSNGIHHFGDTSAFLAGCGGAGSAIAWSLLESGVPQLSLFDRDHNRSEWLADILRTRFPHQPVSTVDTAPSPQHGLVINATTAGMAPDITIPIPVNSLCPCMLVADIVTKPVMTPLLLAAQEIGCEIQTGPEHTIGLAQKMADFLGTGLVMP